MPADSVEGGASRGRHNLDENQTLVNPSQLGNLPASMTRAALAMGNGSRGNAPASPRSAICTWCPLNFGAATGILVVDFDTHVGKRFC